MGRDFLTLWEVGADALSWMVDRARELKRDRRKTDALVGRTVALVFEKPSTRTRVSFDVAVHELGGHATVVDGFGSQMGRGESVADTAQVLDRYVAAIVYRTAGHDRVVDMATHAMCPVVNALTDLTHPCQLVADLVTVKEQFGSLQGVRCAWVGDGNNMAHSWMYAATLLGMELCVATPFGYQPDDAIVATVSTGAVELTTDPECAVRGAKVVSTDTWASMGHERDRDARIAAFAGYGVTAELVARAADDAIVLHCLPAYRGLEIDADVIDGPRSRVWDQAENRLYAHKAILEWAVLEAGPPD